MYIHYHICTHLRNTISHFRFTSGGTRWVCAVYCYNCIGAIQFALDSRNEFVQLGTLRNNRIVCTNLSVCVFIE